MSPELETLDQLLGGDLPLTLIRGLFNDKERFVHAVVAMLDADELQLLKPDEMEVPRWLWRAVLNEASGLPAENDYRLSITEVGARRIA